MRIPQTVRFELETTVWDEIEDVDELAANILRAMTDVSVPDVVVTFDSLTAARAKDGSDE